MPSIRHWKILIGKLKNWKIHKIQNEKLKSDIFPPTIPPKFCRWLRNPVTAGVFLPKMPLQHVEQLTGEFANREGSPYQADHLGDRRRWHRVLISIGVLLLLIIVTLGVIKATLMWKINKVFNHFWHFWHSFTHFWQVKILTQWWLFKPPNSLWKTSTDVEADISLLIPYAAKDGPF